MWRCVCARVCVYVCRLAPGRAAVAQDCKEAAGNCLCHWCHPGKADTQSSSHGHILGPGRSPNTLATTIPLLALSLCFLSLTHRCSLSLSLWHLQFFCSFCLCQQNTHTLARVFLSGHFNIHSLTLKHPRSHKIIFLPIIGNFCFIKRLRIIFKTVFFFFLFLIIV